MEHHELELSPRKTGDECEEPVPEREGVARVQAGVRELADRLQRELVELEDLPCSREMEEAVTLNGSRDRPQDDPEGATCAGRRPAPGNPLGCHIPPDVPDHPRREAGRGEQCDRESERGSDRKGDSERAEDERQRPGESGRDATDAKSAGERPTRSQDERGREEQPNVELDIGHGSRSSVTSPEESHDAAVRYASPRSLRKIAPRSRSAATRRRLAHSA